MKSFSVLTVSKRTGWEEMAGDCIDKQRLDTIGFRGWVVVTENPEEHKKFPYGDVLIVSAPKKVRLSNLNASLNAGLRLIDADYVIFYQDFIELQEGCFEKLLSLADEKTFVTTCTPNYDGSDDGRFTGVGVPRACRPEEWEANVAIAPMAFIRELGGFEEELDWGWSWDNVHLAKRAAMLGARFIIDESNRPKLLPHEQEDKKKLTLNGEWCEKDLLLIREGIKPVKLPYL